MGFEVIPAIDLRAGRVVRLVQGDFAREQAYADDPLDVVRSFALAGVRRLHLVDLDGASAGEPRQLAAVASIAAAAGAAVRCELGGGLRSLAAVEAAVDVGIDRVVLGTAALRDPVLVGDVLRRLGPDRVAVALDVRDGRAVGDGWRPGAGGRPVEEALRDLGRQGVATFEVTAIERDGLLGGPDLELLCRVVEVGAGAIVASGGLTTLADLRAVRAVGCAAAIVGRSLYEGRLDLASAMAVAADGPPGEPGGNGQRVSA
ncbi:MAG TPA: 1-(5-phosphoribosyl)-5-[(5-phosphoribosylamino)methylideneamino] imidazole-4-carboxamide isomerase [Candidatus Limnocylindrales bacterium]